MSQKKTIKQNEYSLRNRLKIDTSKLKPSPTKVNNKEEAYPGETAKLRERVKNLEDSLAKEEEEGGLVDSYANLMYRINNCLGDFDEEKIATMRENDRSFEDLYKYVRSYGEAKEKVRKTVCFPVSDKDREDAKKSIESLNKSFNDLKTDYKSKLVIMG